MTRRRHRTTVRQEPSAPVELGPATTLLPPPLAASQISTDTMPLVVQPPSPGNADR